MSGFTRDTHHYGDQLVYEASRSKWGRYHAHCGCGEDWVTAHAVPAGFRVVRDGGSFVALVGPELTEGVDEDELTTNALWKAVTGQPGSQGYYEQVRHVDRSPAARAARQADNDRVYGERRRRAAEAKKSPLTERQSKYLAHLVTTVDLEQFDAAYAAATKGTGIEPRASDEDPLDAAQRLTRAAARQLISGLVDVGE